MTESGRAKSDYVLDWCRRVLGPFSVVGDHSRTHGGHDSSTRRLQTSTCYCYLKVHQNPSCWSHEVHAYEHWVDAFGEAAPRLLAVRDAEPLALVISEVPGRPAESAGLEPSEERKVWRSAGEALASLHEWETHACFGPCSRDGTCAQASAGNAVEYVSARFGNEIERATRAGHVTEEELATVEAAFDLISAFQGENPVPCHRDYGPANWLVSATGAWAGVVDFEFAHWDVRVADFSRYPDWTWINRPDLVGALFEGYGRCPSAREEQQMMVARAEYALGAILWGHDNSFHGFEREGHESLVHLASVLR